MTSPKKRSSKKVVRKAWALIAEEWLFPNILFQAKKPRFIDFMGIEPKAKTWKIVPCTITYQLPK